MKPVVEKLSKPKRMRRDNTTYERTIYGSYVDTDEYGIAAQKNALSYEALVRLGYKPVN